MSEPTDERSGRSLQPVEYSERIGGSRSALAIALVVVLALGGFIAIGILGREPGNEPEASSDVANVQAAATPPEAASPEAPSRRPSGTSQPAEQIAAIPVSDSELRPDANLAAVLVVGGESHFARFGIVDPDHWFAAFRVPYPRPALEATLVLTQIRLPEGTDPMAIGHWEVSFEPMTLGWEQSDVVLDVAEQPRDQPSAHALVRRGFRVSVTAESRLSFGVLNIDVERADPPAIGLVHDSSLDVRSGRFVTSIGLDQITPGHLHGQLLVPENLAANVFEFTLRSRSAEDPRSRPVTVHGFETALPRFDEFVSSLSVISSLPVVDIQPSGPRLLTYDYQFSAAPSQAGKRAVTVDIRVSAVEEDDGSFASTAISSQR